MQKYSLNKWFPYIKIKLSFQYKITIDHSLSYTCTQLYTCIKLEPRDLCKNLRFVKECDLKNYYLQIFSVNKTLMYLEIIIDRKPLVQVVCDVECYRFWKSLNKKKLFVHIIYIFLPVSQLNRIIPYIYDY